MNNRTKKMSWFFAYTVIFSLFCSIISFADVTDKFVPGTNINGIYVGGLTVEEARNRIQESYTNEYKLTITKKDGSKEYITAGDMGYTVTVPDVLLKLLEEQNTSGRNSGPAINNSHEITVDAKYDEGALEAKIRNLNCISGSDILTTADARITEYQEGQPFTIIKEVEGNNLDVEKTVAVVKEAAKTGKLEVNLHDTGCYYAVNVRATDEALVNLCNLMNQTKDITITYNIRGNAEILSGQIISTWLTGASDGQIQVDKNKAAAYITDMAGRYDTANTTRTFRTVNGKDVSLKGPFGWKMDQAGETDALMAMIRTGQTQSREPESSSKVVSSNADWGNTYVEIDLTGQHVYMIKDGAVAWDAPCVTGNTSKNHTTPPGIYSLYYKERDKVLRGAKRADGSYEYESPVKYWMPFNGGIGLHDADWRGKFGGTIYKNSGSHGCINLPPAKAKILYDLVYKGIPVICYN